MEFRVHAADVGFTEGPTIMQDGSLVFVSIDRGVVYRSAGGELSEWARTGGGPNGATEGPDGNVYIAQNSGKVFPASPTTGVTGGVQVISPDGVVSTVSDDMVHPNDLCFGPDGFLYVTDPTRREARDDGRLWKVDIEAQRAELLVSVPWFPNGIGFGVEDDWLYVARGGQGQVVRLPMSDLKAEPIVVAQLTEGKTDGFAWDTDGNLIVAGITGDKPGELQVFDPSGKLIEILRPGSGNKYTNIALSDTGVLYITDSADGQILAADWGIPGLPLHPFR